MGEPLKDMIKQRQKDQDLPEFKVDIGRPNIHDDESRNFWLEFNDYIHTCEYPIYANNIFYHIEEKIQDPKWSYLGGGYAYMFWFDTEEDKFKFEKKWNIKTDRNDI